MIRFRDILMALFKKIGINFKMRNKCFFSFLFSNLSKFYVSERDFQKQKRQHKEKTNEKENKKESKKNLYKKQENPKMTEEDKADWEMKRERINVKLLRLFQI